MQRLLFLCSGNYYRSRFAEILFNWHAEQRGIEWRAESRGLALDPRNVGPLSYHTTSGLSSRGIAWAAYGRLPMAVAESDFDAADRIIAVKEAEHRPLVEARFSAWCDRVEYWHVHDLDCAAPADAIAELEREVLALVERLSAAAA